MADLKQSIDENRTSPKRGKEQEQHMPPLGEQTQASSKEKLHQRSPGEQAQKYKEEQHMRLQGEQLHAQKQQIQAGEVVLHKEVVSEQMTIDVPVTHEEIVIERRSFTDEPIGASETIRIPVYAEHVDLTKDKVTIGDVVIGKRDKQETQHFSEACQHEEARFEREGEIPLWDMNANQPSSQPGAR